MSVEMVGRDVQNNRDFRPESLDRLKLKARYFEHDHRFGGCAVSQRDRGRSDVAAHKRRKPCRSHDFAREGSRSRLAVRSSDGDNWAGQKLRGKLDLADDTLAERSRLLQRRSVDRHARRNDDQILSAERALAVSSGFDGNPVVQQHGDFVAQFVAALGIGNRNLCAMPFQKQRRSHTGLPQADHQHAFAVQFHQCLFHHRVTETRGKSTSFAADRHGFSRIKPKNHQENDPRESV